MAAFDIENDPQRNPCTFKQVCNVCTMVAIEGRPDQCLGLECPEYKPCKKCGMNRDLDGNGLCKVSCSRKKIEQVLVRNAEGKAELVADVPPTNWQLGDGTGRAITPTGGATAGGIDIKITLPGTAPDHYTQAEKDFYNEHWEMYKGYYRDPTCYTIVHNLILLEVELNFVTGWLNQARTGFDKTNEARRSAIINSMDKLRGQLPQKEMQEMTDDEKSLAMIYDRYLSEKKLRYVSGVSRMISPEAIALAPVMPFKMDLFAILKRMGYTPMDIMQALEKCYDTDEIPQDPGKMLEWMGIFLKEQYAMTEEAIPAQVDSEFALDEEES